LRINSSGNVGIGLGATDPSTRLHVLSTTEQIRCAFDASNYFSTTIGATGSATLNLTGTSPEFTFSDPVNVPDEAYGVGWDGNTEVPTKNAIYDKFEGMFLSNTASLDFGNTAPSTSTDLTITVTGAVDGDVVSIGVPNGSTLSNGVFTAWVSAANTVTVRFTNTDALASLDPASGTFKVTVIK